VGEGDFKRVLVLAPSHSCRFRGASIPQVGHYETPLGLVPLDLEACAKLREKPLFQCVPDAHTREHSLEIQLPFLQARLGDFKLIPVVLGEVSGSEYAEIAQTLKPYVGKDTLLVASSDFTHFGWRFRYPPGNAAIRSNLQKIGWKFDYPPHGENVRENLKKLDLGAVDLILQKDAAGLVEYQRNTGATICGRKPIAVLLNMLPDGAQGTLLKYYTSGDLEGEYSNSVSYVSLAFTIPGTGEKAEGAAQASQADSATTKAKAEPSLGKPGRLTRTERLTLLRIAKDAVEMAVRTGDRLDLTAKKYTITPSLLEHCGAFVTLKNHGKLRGCIGRFVAQKPLFEVIRDMAIASATEDHRFRSNPVTASELKEIDINISVLSPLKRIKNPLDLKLGVHGIYIRQGWRAGCFLPQVATETGWDKETFLSRCCAGKAGLRRDAWKDPKTEVYVFTAEVFHEPKEEGGPP